MRHILKCTPVFLLALLLSSCSGEFMISAPTREAAVSFGDLEPQAQGVTYYVSGRGNDRNDGLSQRGAFRTLQRAADLTLPGDTVLVMSGTYTKSAPSTNVLEIRRSGAPGRYIQYRAYPGHSPRILLKNNWAGIQISAAYIVVEGFTVQGNAPSLSAARARELALLPKSRKAEALNTSLYNSAGIFAYPFGGQDPHHLIIRNNHVFNCAATGISSNGSDYVRIENNLVHNNSYYSPYATSGISFYQSRDVDTNTGTKMFVRNNTVFGNENRVPFWFSNEDDPGKRVITDGNGIIVDDGRNTQSFVGDAGTPYRGATDVVNNVIYNNGGRAVSVFESDNVRVRYNTTYRNARVRSPSITSELLLGNASNVSLSSNIVVARGDRATTASFGVSRIRFDNNLMSGGSGLNYPSGAFPNLLKNGTFTNDLSGWGLSVDPSAGFASNTRDEFKRNCVYIDEGNQPNPYDVYLFQKGFELVKGANYLLSFDAITGTGQTSDITVKLGQSGPPYRPYAGQTFRLVGDQPQAKSLSFRMTASRDTNAQLELQLAGNAPGSYFCFDNVVLSRITDRVAAPRFIKPGGGSSANFRLRPQSPAIDAGTSAAPATDAEGNPRPKGAAPDVGAYESY